MAAEFKNLGIILPELVSTAIDGHKGAKQLFETLTKLDTQAAGVDVQDNMRLRMLQSGIKQGLEQVDDLGASGDIDFLIQTLSVHIDLVMGADIGDESGSYESEGFRHIESDSNHFVEYSPIKISENFGALRRAEMCFVDQPGMNQQTIHCQPFVERSDDPLSIKFAEEYYRYCCNPIDYPGSKIKSEDIRHQERFPITPNVLKHMEEKVGATLADLKIYKFFNMEYKDHIMPTHGLLCQMFLMCSLATAPFYLAGGHLGDPQENNQQFEYYTQFLIHNDAHVIPNRQGFIKVLQILVTLLKNKKEHGSRLVQQEISVDELFPLMKEQDVGPFELYEDLLREQFCLVNNITEGDTIGFKLTGTGIMFLYMCCPKI